MKLFKVLFYVSCFLIGFYGWQALAESCVESVTGSSIDDKMEINTITPKHLKGAKITVELADGSKSTVSAEKFKVVPRMQQFIVTKATLMMSKTCKADAKLNRVSLMGGKGPTGRLERDASAAPAKVSVEAEHDGVAGAQYQRLLTERLSVGVQGQTNKTGMVMIGLDF